MIKGLTLQSILPSIVMIICNIAALGETPGTNIEALHKPIRNLVITDPMLAYAQAEEEIRVGTANREPNRVGLGHLIMGNVHWVLGNLPSAQEKYYPRGVFSLFSE